MKQLLKKIVTGSSLLRHSINQLTGNFPKVFVYHRFASQGSKIAHRVSADEFGWQLDQIQSHFQVITFGECLTHFKEHGKWPRNSVVITVDDGYRDFYEFAYPELVKRGLKATFFVTTNFVEGKIWLWPDRLEHAIQSSVQTEITVVLNGSPVCFALGDKADKMYSWQKLAAYCISSPDAEKERFIGEVVAALCVELPLTPLSEYAAVSWEHLQEMQRGGIEIGGHTMNHPILSKISPELLDSEIGMCKQILEERLVKPVRSFCYTNSGPGDINDAVVAAVVRAGYSGAVFGTNLAIWDRFQVPRMGINDDRTDFLWKLFGGESIAYSTRKSR